jgi:hypothetical protein
MRSRKPGVMLRVVQGTVIVLFAAVTPVVPLGMLTDQMPPPDLVVRFNGWREVLDVIGRVIPEVSVILDVVRFFLSIVSCANA